MRHLSNWRWLILTPLTRVKLPLSPELPLTSGLILTSRLYPQSCPRAAGISYKVLLTCPHLLFLYTLPPHICSVCLIGLSLRIPCPILLFLLPFLMFFFMYLSLHIIPNFCPMLLSFPLDYWSGSTGLRMQALSQPKGRKNPPLTDE